METRGFGSDNHSGVLPEVLDAIAQANEGHAPSYGTDPWSQEALELIQQHFGKETRAHFVFNGTAANVLSLKAVTERFHSVFCTTFSHLHNDECGAPEAIAGVKLMPIEAEHGKLTPDLIEPFLIRRGDQHYSQPRVVSITQPTEVGCVYSSEEIRTLASFAHEQGLLLHVDGARLVNAAAFLDCGLADVSTGVGADVVSFGGTKNGLLCGEAVVFARPELEKNFKYLRKQCLQLPSKSRFVAAQFVGWLSNDTWLRNARHANAMAQRLCEAVEDIRGVEVTHPVQANGVFARIPQAWVKPLRKESFFYVWDEHTFEVRWMTTFDTTPDDVDRFAAAMRRLA